MMMMMTGSTVGVDDSAGDDVRESQRYVDVASGSSIFATRGRHLRERVVADISVVNGGDDCGRRSLSLAQP